MVPRTALPGNDVSIARRIDAGRSRMPSAMARVADVVEQHPDAPLELTITELAVRARTSAATVTRFCRLIGFDGYTQFRVRVASEIGRASVAPESPRRARRDLAPDDPPEVLVQTLMETHRRALEATADRLDLTAISRAAEAIANSDHLDIYAVGGSGIMAAALQGRLYRIGVNAHLWTAAHDGLASAALRDRTSVAIGISSTGTTVDTVQMLSRAAVSGAFTIAITHDAQSALADLADVVVTTAAHVPELRPDDLSVKHSQMFVLDLLYLLVAQQDFATATARLTDTARAVAALRRPRRTTPVRLPRGIQEIR
nr:MurR/RpiR family transcriptional regulator [Microbacterium bovistercoris]